MSDYSREQAIQWCRDNSCDFIDPVFPPPDGWMWVEPEILGGLYLTAIFTHPECPEDIRFKDAAIDAARGVEG